ncbi:hypothetical protein ASG52_04170 [Methylobacterium sp. Leaf456]|uniref:hypothetical protein n=1 Tax=Methylobacterium sp. Leaf456 TaxID=1736382 RepID=UPI0007005D37|nr:hypothetical protein [Methylobacterium sp. Leaf456]KQT53332.1 hypothetical protein ASG52_04170 [Methylobacterium sp. Leaf456]
MPIFDAKNLPHHDDDLNVLATILHPTPVALEQARERGRARLERATMLAELAPALPGTTLAALTMRDAVPAA